MTFFDYLFIGLAAVAVLIILGYALYTGNFFKSLIFSAIGGIVALLIVHFTSGLTGFSLELTPYTIGGAGIFGLPGVVCMTVCKMIFGL